METRRNVMALSDNLDGEAQAATSVTELHASSYDYFQPHRAGDMLSVHMQIPDCH